ncbi:MAG: hypothetical protein EOP00_34175 [Pedobacter sp.]|nr:MAG: hypothetical protein EOP00_34175 [Pedobacter sp.]
MQNKVHIPQPCKENWNAMTPNKNGRFCNSCSKTVVDFTRMDNIVMQKYFQDSAKDVCGYFRADQVDSRHESLRYELETQFAKIKIQPIRKLALLSLGLLFLTSSCFMGKRATTGEVSNSDSESVEKNEIIVQDQKVNKVADSTAHEKK